MFNSRPRSKAYSTHSVFQRRCGNDQGAMLMIVLWLLIILSIMAISFSRRMAIELSLTKNAVDKLRSKYLAMAGFQYALGKISRGSSDNNFADTLWQCGVKLDDQQIPEDLFRQVAINGGHFDVGYDGPSQGDQRNFVYGRFFDRYGAIGQN